MAKIHESPEARERLPLPRDWFTVVTSDWHWKVSREMATHVERALVEQPMPRWVVFVDLAGSRVRLRTALIDFVEQTTADQRRVERAITAALKREAKAQEQEQEEDD
jgi:hypothetical protein